MSTASLPWLTNTSAFARFDTTLKANLDDQSYRFFSFYTNRARIELSLNSLLTYVDKGTGALLNVGAGAFVIDFILEQLRPWSIVSLDREPIYIPLYRDLRRQELLTRTSFLIADLRSCHFRSHSFHCILAHDLFYEPTLDLSLFLPLFAQWLRPGGHLYFDIWDQRASTLWKLTSRSQSFRRYDLSQVRQQLEECGFRIVTEAPYFGHTSGLRYIRKLLWQYCRFSNTRHFLVQRCAE